MNMKIFYLVAAIFSTLTTTGCDAVGKSYPPYRYRLTVEVDTPQGVRTGSSVIEGYTSVAGRYSIPSPGAVSGRFKGQGVAVTLPNGQAMFALLGSDKERDWAGGIYMGCAVTLPPVKERIEMTKRGEDLFDLMMRQTLASHRKCDVPRWRPNLFGRRSEGPMTNWPMMVRFRDIHDRWSIERIDPDNLPATFGRGYAIRRLTVERTDAPITTGITKLVPKADAEGWFNWDGHTNPSDPAKFAYGIDLFWRGVIP